MERAISPVIGVVLLTACTVLLSVTVGVMAVAYDPSEPASLVVIDGEADAEDNEITLTLEQGDSIDVRDLSLVIEIDGEALETQPTRTGAGVNGSPTGSFNWFADPTWDRGESTSFEVASNNSPHPEPGSTVEIRVFENDLSIATIETTAT